MTRFELLKKTFATVASRFVQTQPGGTYATGTYGTATYGTTYRIRRPK